MHWSLDDKNIVCWSDGVLEENSLTRRDPALSSINAPVGDHAPMIEQIGKYTVKKLYPCHIHAN